MRAVLFLAAHELRARWRGWAVLVVLVALAGGAVLAAAAGASRTDSAYPRFLTASKASDLLVVPYFSGQGGYLEAVALLPDVDDVARAVSLNLQPLGRGGRAARHSLTLVALDGRLGQVLEVPKLLAGRLPAADRAGEIAVNQRGAAMMGVQVGSVLTMRAVPHGPLPGVVPAGTAPPRLVRERVVGIMVTRGSVLPITENDKVPAIMASPALFDRLAPQYAGGDGAYVKLRPGASAEAFRQRAQALTGQFPDTGGRVDVADEGAQAAAVQHAIRPQAVALALFALVLGVTALLIVGQAATRLLATASPDTPALAALGMTRRQLTAAGLIEVGAAASRRRDHGCRGGSRRVAADAGRGGPAGRARPGHQRRRDGAGGWRRRHRRAAGGGGGMAGVAAGVGGRPREQPGRSAGPAVAAGRMAGPRQCAGDRDGGGGAGVRIWPRAYRRAGARRPGRHRTVSARGHRRDYLRRQPAASGQRPAALRKALGRRDRSAI